MALEVPRSDCGVGNIRWPPVQTPRKPVRTHFQVKQGEPMLAGEEVIGVHFAGERATDSRS